MLDIAKYIRGFMPIDKLSEHIWKDSGGSAVSFLENILSPESQLITKQSSFAIQLGDVDCCRNSKFCASFADLNVST
jgi:hypothetical protein